LCRKAVHLPPNQANPVLPNLHRQSLRNLVLVSHLHRNPLVLRVRLVNQANHRLRNPQNLRVLRVLPPNPAKVLVLNLPHQRAANLVPQKVANHQVLNPRRVPAAKAVLLNPQKVLLLNRLHPKVLLPNQVPVNPQNLPVQKVRNPHQANLALANLHRQSLRNPRLLRVPRAALQKAVVANHPAVKAQKARPANPVVLNRLPVRAANPLPLNRPNPAHLSLRKALRLRVANLPVRNPRAVPVFQVRHHLSHPVLRADLVPLNQANPVVLNRLPVRAANLHLLNRVVVNLPRAAAVNLLNLHQAALFHL